MVAETKADLILYQLFGTIVSLCTNLLTCYSTCRESQHVLQVADSAEPVDCYN